MTIEGLDLAILGPAFVAGLLVLATHVPLGRVVLQRGIIFIDLAIAQIAAVGVIVAYRFGWDTHGWEVQFVAMASALLGAALLSFLEKYFELLQEALIGVIFVLAATASVLLLADNPHGGEQLKELLVGQILWLSWSQLLPLAVMTVVILLCWFKAPKNVARLAFYPLFALAVTSSVQMVGVYLVFASLILPALASHGDKPVKALMVGYIIGGLGYATGLVFSALWDLPSGALIVWCLAVTALAWKILTAMVVSNR
jgi:zinc/manganese transport system permease protein